MAERLGSGLQNHLQRFKSARDLEQTQREIHVGFFCAVIRDEFIRSRRIAQKNQALQKPLVCEVLF